MSSFSFNPNSLQGMGSGGQPFGGAQGLSSPFASFFGGSQALGQLQSKINPNSFGGNIFSAMMDDYAKTNQTLGLNFERGLQAEQGLTDVLSGLTGRAQDFTSQLNDLVTGMGERIEGTAQEHLGDITDWATETLGKTQDYIDRGIDKWDTAIGEYGDAQAATWAAQSLAADQQADAFLERALSGNEGMMMDPGQKAALAASVNNQKMQVKQSEIGKLQARVEDVILQNKGALSQMMVSAGGMLGNLGVQLGGLIQRGQQGVQAAQQFVAGLRTQTQLEGRKLELQAEQLAIGGFSALANMINMNKLSFASSGPVALAAANLAQMGLNPFQGSNQSPLNMIQGLINQTSELGPRSWDNMNQMQQLLHLFRGGGRSFSTHGEGYPDWYVPPNVASALNIQGGIGGMPFQAWNNAMQGAYGITTQGPGQGAAPGMPA